MVNKETNNLLTKFFYRDNYLHFQILVQTANDTQICGEFTNYDEYRQSFDALRTRLADFKSQVTPAGKNFKWVLSLKNVA